MALLSTGLNQIVYNGHSLSLSGVSWSVRAIYKVNPSRTGWVSWRPGLTFTPFSTLEKDGFYLIDAVSGFELPDAQIVVCAGISLPASATIPLGLSQFLYSGATVTLSGASWLANVRAVYAVNSAQTGWVSFKPAAAINSLSSLESGKFYLIDTLSAFALTGAQILACPEGFGGDGGTGSTTERFTQPGHGFLRGTAVQPANPGWALWDGVTLGVRVVSFVDGDDFEICHAGRFSIAGASFTPGTGYFFDDTAITSLNFTSTDPLTLESNIGKVRKPLFFVGYDDMAIVLPDDAFVIGEDSGTGTGGGELAFGEVVDITSPVSFTQACILTIKGVSYLTPVEKTGEGIDPDSIIDITGPFTFTKKGKYINGLTEYWIFLQPI